MPRDMDLIRQLLLKLEALNVPRGGTYFLTGDEAELAIEGFSEDQILHHLALLRDARFILGPGKHGANEVGFTSLSWAGCNFLDSVRDPEIWDKTKKGALAAGGFTIELLGDLAKGFIKKQIEDRTGVKL